MLGTLITILIQGIAHDEASLDPYSYEYQDMLRHLKLILRYTRFSTNATVCEWDEFQLPKIAPAFRMSLCHSLSSSFIFPPKFDGMRPRKKTHQLLGVISWQNANRF